MLDLPAGLRYLVKAEEHADLALEGARLLSAAEKPASPTSH